MKTYICQTCGDKFRKSKPSKFCNWICYRKAHPQKSFTCEGCGKKFQSKQTRRFCSRKCFNETWKGEKHPCYDFSIPNVKCKYCNKEFRATYKRKFCSSNCFYNYHKGTCSNCGELFSRRRSDQVCCSLDCTHEYFIAEQSKIWKGGEYKDCSGVIHTYSGIDTYKRKHRLTVKELIGRDLFADERIWHLDCNLSNNSPDNLYIFKSQAEMARAIQSKNLPVRSNIQRKNEWHSDEN